MIRTRRDLLRSGAGGLAALALPGVSGWAADAKLRDDPFTLGVASGFPTLRSIALWTRLAPQPDAPGGGLGNAVIPVTWIVAEDERFRRIVATGTEYATPDWAHSIHAEPWSLEPAREYWYRFEAAGHRSPKGRFRTAPAPASQTASLSAAVVCCQHYEHGHYAAYRHIAGNTPDVVLHLGDYIYESNPAASPVRALGLAEAYTLDDYRRRYAAYKRDASLQAAHAAAAWLLVWDDHEVDNDYAGEYTEDGQDPEYFLARRAAAYRAYYEHMPLPRRAVPYGPMMRMHAQHAYGDLAAFSLLDQRQFRSREACATPWRGGGRVLTDCAEIDAPERTMLGATQEGWLAAQFGASAQRWNFIAQGTVMADVDQKPGPGRGVWTDGWTGYPAARRRLMESIGTTRLANPVVLSGDLHAFGVAELRADPRDPATPLVAPEFVTTSISSTSLAQPLLDSWVKESPELAMLDGRERGYVRLDITPARLDVAHVAVRDIRDPRSPVAVTRRYGVEAGSPRVHRA